MKVAIVGGARENTSIALRIQHTSNGGLNSANPGLDMIGFNFVFTFLDDQTEIDDD